MPPTLNGRWWLTEKWEKDLYNSKSPYTTHAMLKLWRHVAPGGGGRGTGERGSTDAAACRRLLLPLRPATCRAPPPRSRLRPSELRSSYTMRTKCAISDAFVRDCVFAYCASVAQYVYSLSAEHYFRLRNSAISDKRVRDCALSTHSVFRPLEPVTPPKLLSPHRHWRDIPVPTVWTWVVNSLRSGCDLLKFRTFHASAIKIPTRYLIYVTEVSPHSAQPRFSPHSRYHM